MKEARNLFRRRARGNAATEIFWTSHKKSKRLGKIASRRVVVRATIAAEPRCGGIDTPQLHPFFASRRSVVRYIKRMTELMRDVVSQ